MLRRVVHRLAMLTAIVVTCGLFTPCKADLTLTTPAGLTAGDTFRFVFVTDGTTAATSTNITDYDSFVQSQAGGATYNGDTITWQAICSTDAISAITHLGTNPGISGVYRVDGTQVAAGDGTGNEGIWSGSLLAPIGGIPLLDPFVWTGTQPNGSVALGHALGGSSAVFGAFDSANGAWVDNFFEPSAVALQLYGMSDVLVVPTISSVPEPSSLVLVGSAIPIGLALAWSRKCKGQRRQDQVGPSEVSQ
jgi:hypothetical protein